MADWANALVKFELNPQFKDAFETIFKRKGRTNRLNWFEYFEFVTTDGVLKRINAVDNDNLDWLCFNGNIGHHVNLFYEHSIDDKQGIDGKIVTLQFSKKWSDISAMTDALEDFLAIVSSNILFCEVIAADANGDYYCVLFDVVEHNNHGFKMLHFKEKERHLLSDT